MEIFVIGDRNTVMGMRLVGLDGVVASGRDAALTALRDAVQNKTAGIVLVTERLAALMRDEMDDHAFGCGFPLVLEIPDASGPSPNRVSIAEIVRRAIGVSL